MITYFLKRTSQKVNKKKTIKQWKLSKDLRVKNF